MREQAKSPQAARHRYSKYLQLALSCLSTTAVWYGGEIEGYSALITEPDQIRLKGDVGNLLLSASQRFEIVDDDRYEGEFRTHTLAYIYELQVESTHKELISWHWHPLTTPDRPAPHLHAAGSVEGFGMTLSKAHVPTGRVSFEAVVRFCFTDLGVTPAREDEWREIVGETEERFRSFRSWA